MAKEKEGGVVIGNRNIFSASYADDIALLATFLAGLREMLKRLERYLKNRGPELSPEETKWMTFRKSAEGRRKKEVLTWKGVTIEGVKEFCYLGYTINCDTSNGIHVGRLVSKAKAVMVTVWSIVERMFKDNWSRRLQLFDALVSSIMQYGTEIWGWEEWKVLKKKKKCYYLKWFLQLFKCTPEYGLLLEKGREKNLVLAGNRALKYDDKIGRDGEDSILKTMWLCLARSGADVGSIVRLVWISASSEVVTASR